MKQTLCVSLLLLFPGVMLADAMCLQACVLEKRVYQKLVEKAGGVEKVSKQDIRKAAVYRRCFKKYDSGSFNVEGKQFRVLICRKANRLLYSIAQVIKKKQSKSEIVMLECVGEVKLDNRPKKGWKKDSFVLVVHAGNYVLK